MKVKVTAEVWRTKPHTLAGEELKSCWALHSSPEPVVESADVFPTISKMKLPCSAVAWYHRNENSPAFNSTLKLQSLESIAGTVHDPLLYRTFGGFITASGPLPGNSVSKPRLYPPPFQCVAGHAIESTVLFNDFAIRIASPCCQAKDGEDWLRCCSSLTPLGESWEDCERAKERTSAAWRSFWDRSRVVVEGDHPSIPGSEHPLRIGYDSNGGNKFAGEIRWVALYNREAFADEIARAVKYGGPDPEGLVFHEKGRPRSIDELKGYVLKFGFTLEAGITLKSLTPGRIFDRMTAAGSDGFLFDTHPGDTLRLIVGSTTLQRAARHPEGREEVSGRRNV